MKIVCKNSFPTTIPFASLATGTVFLTAPDDVPMIKAVPIQHEDGDGRFNAFAPGNGQHTYIALDCKVIPLPNATLTY